jgi:hypothetical protein
MSGLICRGIPPWAPPFDPELSDFEQKGAHGGTPLQN